MSTSLALASVPVCGEVLRAGRDEKGTVWVSIPHVSEVLGIDSQRQAHKLRSTVWAGVSVLFTPSPGGSQATACLPLRAFPMWLATIHASKVRPETRDKLERFQCEAADVLAAYFLGGVQDNGRIHMEQSAITDTPQRVEALEAEVASLALALGELQRAHGKRLDGVEKAMAGAGVQLALPLLDATARAEAEAAFRERVRAAAESLPTVRMVALLDALGVNPKMPSGKLQRRIGAALRALGYTNAERPRFQGPRARVWIRREVLQ